MEGFSGNEALAALRLLLCLLFLCHTIFSYSLGTNNRPARAIKYINA